MKILVLDGPNLNLLGERDKNHYGSVSLKKIRTEMKKIAGRSNELKFYQTNHEGRMIDFIQKNRKWAQTIIINPAAWTHYSIALRDCLEDTRLPIIEVHLSDISNREDFRKINVFAGLSQKVFLGKKENSYYAALTHLLKVPGTFPGRKPDKRRREKQLEREL